MWNPNDTPMEFIIQINNPPSIEFNTSFIIFLSGHISTFPNIIIAAIQDKKIIIVFVFSICFPPKSNLVLAFNTQAEIDSAPTIIMLVFFYYPGYFSEIFCIIIPKLLLFFLYPFLDYLSYPNLYFFV